MWNGDEALAWAVLLRAPGLDRASLGAALARSGSAAALLDRSTTAKASNAGGGGLAGVARAFLRSPAARPLDSERRWLERPHHHLIPFTDPRFPSALASIPNGPLGLYVAGHAPALNDPQIAMVGSRCPTPQGRETATSFAEYFGERGLGVTSGLAEGIDASAHRGALKADGMTIGVLGTGIDVVFPRRHRDLSEEIARRGALVSEFPLGTPPRRGNFPQRNRLIAALSLGTLVIEAARRSGSLITARLANAYGREVFAIPGSIRNPLSQGCHKLIKAGAKLVETADEVLRELNFSDFFVTGFAASADPAARLRDTEGMDKDHKILLDALGFDPVDLDGLVTRTGFKPEALSSMLLILELEGHVQTAPGGRYSRIVNRRAGGER